MGFPLESTLEVNKLALRESLSLVMMIIVVMVMLVRMIVVVVILMMH